MAVDDILEVVLPSHPDAGYHGAVAGAVVLLVVATVVLIAISSRPEPRVSGCDDTNFGGWGSVTLTTRDFDLGRSAYVDEPLAVADPWPGAVDSIPDFASLPWAEAAAE